MAAPSKRTAQQRHLQLAAAAAAVAVAFCSAIRNTSQTRPNKDPYLAGDKALEPDAQLFPSLCLASPRRSLNPGLRTHQSRQRRFKIPCYTWTPKIKSGDVTQPRPLIYWLWIKLFFLFVFTEIWARDAKLCTHRKEGLLKDLHEYDSLILLIQQKQDVHVFSLILTGWCPIVAVIKKKMHIVLLKWPLRQVQGKTG